MKSNKVILFKEEEVGSFDNLIFFNYLDNDKFFFCMVEFDSILFEMYKNSDADKKDSILLSAQKSVSLSTNTTVNINTKNMVVDASSIKLGSKNARESVVKGDTLFFQLNSVLKALIQMTSILKTSQSWPNGVPVADVAKNQVYDSVQTQLQLVQEDLETMLSKNVKTI